MMKTKSLIIYLVLWMIPNSYSSEWANICNMVEGLHRLDKLDKLKLDEGDLIIRLVNITLDKEDKKFTSITYSQKGDEVQIIINSVILRGEDFEYPHPSESVFPGTAFEPFYLFVSIWTERSDQSPIWF